MITRISFSIVFYLLLPCLTPSYAFAGDGATIVLKNGTTVYLNKGFKQIESGIRSAFRNNSKSLYIEVKLGTAPFYINLDNVAIVCRDQCSSMKSVEMKTSSR